MFLATCPNPRLLQRQWKHERNLRQHILERVGWRRSIGLALLMDCKPEEYCHHGLHVLMHNDYARWLILRDLLAGQYYPDRVISLASIVPSRLRYNLPSIDFSTAPWNWNFGRRPRTETSHARGISIRQQMDVMDSDRWARELAAFNRLSLTMTQLQSGQQNGPRQMPAVPRPLLAFDRRDLPQLCQSCIRRIDHQNVPGKQFSYALAQGLPLQATEPMCYLGPTARSRLPADIHGLPVTSHWIQSELDEQTRIIYLPSNARIHVSMGQSIDPSDIWCHALPGRLRRCSRRRGWHLDRAMAGFLQRIWFENQAISIKETPDQILIPCELVSHLCRDFQPVGLWWDLTDSLDHFDAELEAIILPPIPRTWAEQLRFESNIDVDLNAGPAKELKHSKNVF
jgi:hypothetical protein